MLKVMAIIGSRPEGIKMAPVVKELQRAKNIETTVCLTAQHREMLDQVMQVFDIEPDIDLDVMRPNQKPTEVLARILLELEPVLAVQQPDWILVQGDTTTVLAVSLLAFHMKIKVGHVEAGLRTPDKNEPFPEEMNRRVASLIADLHFAPTQWAADNLLREHVQPNSVIVTGNPVVDALQVVISQDNTAITNNILTSIGWNASNEDPRLILVTAHRRDNFGEPLQHICQALAEIARTFDDLQIVYPVHPNPNIKQPVHTALSEVNNIHLIEPVDYLTIVQLMNYATLILTDSGGIQEEAPGLGVPVLVMRNVTERPEGVEAGVAKLVGTDKELIVSLAKRLLSDKAFYQSMSNADNPYGDGNAAQRIVSALQN